MKILSIDTSVNLSIALFKDEQIIEKSEIFEKRSSSENLAPEVDRIMKEHELTAKDIERIIINPGPGSFTGIRVGLSFIKGFAFPFFTPVISINSMESLLSQKKSDIAILESKHDEVYLSRDGKNIEAILKKDLASKVMRSEKIVTNEIKDLKDYLPKNKFFERALSAENLFYVAKRKINHFVDIEALDALYVKAF